MAKRRDKGDGSIYPSKDADGKIAGYVGSLDLGYVNGKRVRKKVTGATRKAVTDKLAALRRQVEAGVDVTAKLPLLDAFFAKWMDEVYAQRIKPATSSSYRNVYRYYAAPALGTTRIDRIGPLDIQNMLTALTANGYAGATLRLVHTVLRKALDQAVKWKMIAHNPAVGVVLPKAQRHAAQFLTVEQARALLSAARGERLELALRIALMLGLRRGEVLGLRWEDVKDGVLHVRGNVQYIQGTGVVNGTPKTEYSRRAIRLPTSLAAALRWHQSKQEAERNVMGAKWTDSGFVFVNTTNGGMMQPVVLVHAFKAAAARANLAPSLRFHDLRHSCASFLAAEKVPLKVASALLGHSSITITADLYQHLFAETLAEATDAVVRSIEDVAHEDTDAEAVG